MTSRPLSRWNCRRALILRRRVLPGEAFPSPTRTRTRPTPSATWKIRGSRNKPAGGSLESLAKFFKLQEAPQLGGGGPGLFGRFDMLAGDVGEIALRLQQAVDVELSLAEAFLHELQRPLRVRNHDVPQAVRFLLGRPIASVGIGGAPQEVVASYLKFRGRIADAGLRLADG